LAPYAAILAGWVDEVPDITMPEFLIKQGFSFKKNTAGDRSRSR
jgi:hypothetical protein